jgi:hypothetical protein
VTEYWELVVYRIDFHGFVVSDNSSQYQGLKPLTTDKGALTTL